MASSKDNSFVHQLSPLDHLHPRIHTARFLYFSTNEDADRIVSNLRDALAKSIASFPIISGSVGLMDGAPQMGTMAVQAPFFKAEDILNVKDLSDKYDYQSIRARNFPPDAVDKNLAVPDFRGNHSRVLLAQANLIKGGVLLVVGIHHTVVDETGLFTILKLWAAFCRGDDGAALIKPEWTDWTAIKVGEGTGLLENHPEYRLRPSERSGTHLKTYQEYLAGGSEGTVDQVIFFSDEALERLKTSATKKIAESNSSVSTDSQWISTNDALCALIWSRVTAARKLGVDVPYSMFNMTVDGRSRLDPQISAEYIGNVVFVTTKAVLPIALLDSPEASLGDISLNIRQSILAVDDKAMKDKIKAATKVDDIGRLLPEGYSSHFRFLACTSWAGQTYYGLDWGKALGGVIKRV